MPPREQGQAHQRYRWPVEQQCSPAAAFSREDDGSDDGGGNNHRDNRRDSRSRSRLLPRGQSRSGSGRVCGPASMLLQSIVFALAFEACFASVRAEQCHDASCRALGAATSLLEKFQHGEDGLFGDTLPWVEANAIETLADWALHSGGLDSAALSAVRPQLERMLTAGFSSTDQGPCHTPFCGSFDDQAWWALAWLKAHELTGRDAFLLRAVRIFEYLRAESWDESACGGGCWWSSKKTYKNAVTSELFFSLAAQLHEPWLRYEAGTGSPPFDFPPNYFHEWAKKTWSWIDSSDLRGANGLFVDGLNSEQWHCTGNGDGANNTWTYNQGIVLSGLGKLYEQTGDPTLLDTAVDIVRSVLAHMTAASPEGNGQRVLVEIGCDAKSGCGENQAMFKGAFIRHLGYLRRTPGLDPARAATFEQFARSNADSSWWHARQERQRFRRVRGPSVQQLFADDWRGPFVEDDAKATVATAQVGALALFASLIDHDAAAAAEEAAAAPAGSLSGGGEGSTHAAAAAVYAGAARQKQRRPVSSGPAGLVLATPGGSTFGRTSTWSAVVLCAAALSLGYLLLGFAHGKIVRGEQGVKALPHAGFWIGIGGLVKEGAWFSHSKIIAGRATRVYIPGNGSRSEPWRQTSAAARARGGGEARPLLAVGAVGSAGRYGTRSSAASSLGASAYGSIG